MKRIGYRIWPSNTELRQYEEVIQQYTRCQSKAKGDLLSDVLIYTFNESFFISVLLQIDIGQHSTFLPNRYHDVISGRRRGQTETVCLIP